jgi:hypothetical protein
MGRLLRNRSVAARGAAGQTRWPVHSTAAKLLAASFGLTWACALAVGRDALAADRSATSVACVEAWGDARYGAAGYDHYVHVRNHCERAVECRVWTNVNPARTDLTVPSHGENEVLTFRGSPAREFVPHAECRLVE